MVLLKQFFIWVQTLFILFHFWSKLSNEENVPWYIKNSKSYYLSILRHFVIIQDSLCAILIVNVEIHKDNIIFNPSIIKKENQVKELTFFKD